jgi:hypothetical protein
MGLVICLKLYVVGMGLHVPYLVCYVYSLFGVLINGNINHHCL